MTAARPKRTSKTAPDLSAISDALSDAYALVWTAHQVIVEGNHGPEEGALRLGVEALERVCGQLDDAEYQLARFNKDNSAPRSTS